MATEAAAPKTEIRILGQKISLKSTEKDQEVIRQIIDLVSLKLQIAEGRAGKNPTPHQVTLLALLDLAEDYVKAKKRTSDFKKKIHEKSEAIATLFDQIK